MITSHPAVRDDAGLVKIIASGARHLDVDLDRIQIDRLVAYVRLIERWNGTYNLTAIRDAKAMVTHHVLDSMSMLPSLEKDPAQPPFRLLDVGSGAGLPGVIIAIARPSTDVTCVDSVGKKTAFIAHVAAELGLHNMSSIHARVETLKPPPSYRVITSRAFASLPAFVSSTRHLLESGGRWVAMKGKIPRQELAAARGLKAEFEVREVHVPGLDADRSLLIGKDLQ